MDQTLPVHTSSREYTSTTIGDFNDDSTPDRLLGDKVALYPRCRYAKRKHLVQELDADQKKKVEDEVYRILKLRKICMAGDGNRETIKKLKEFKRVWKIEAILNRA